VSSIPDVLDGEQTSVWNIVPLLQNDAHHAGRARHAHAHARTAGARELCRTGIDRLYKALSNRRRDTVRIISGVTVTKANNNNLASVQDSLKERAKEERCASPFAMGARLTTVTTV